MENSYFERQDAFVTEMIAAYDQGQMPAIVKPYMDWREARVMISRLAEMRMLYWMPSRQLIIHRST